MPQFTRAGTSSAEAVYTTVLNVTTGTSVVGNAVYWGTVDTIVTAANLGIAVTDQGTDYGWARRLAGIWAQAVAKLNYGLVQAWGVASVYVQTATTGPQHGDILVACSGTAYTGSTAGLVVGVRSAQAANAQEAFPHVLILSAATCGTFNIGFIRCLH